jgi:hypothetical protein
MASVPPPDELPSILRHLKRPVKKRDELAKDERTRAFLDAGVRLINAEFQPSTATDESAGVEHETDRKFLAWLSQRMVAKETAREPGHFGVTDGAFRYRWESTGDYLADLISYMLWSGHWSIHVATADSSKEALTVGDIVSGVHEVAYVDQLAVLDMPSFRFQLVATATADRDPVVREALRVMYDTVTRSWRDLYASVITSLGVRLRPDITLDDLTNMLSAAAEGLGIRLAADPEAPVLDHDNQRALLGTMAIALGMAAIDSGDGMTLEEAFADVVSKSRVGSEQPGT